MMKISEVELSRLVLETTRREKQETNALGSVASDVLKKLNITIDSLPQKCQKLLLDVANKQITMNVDSSDRVGLSLLHTENMSEQLQQDYQILKLKQKNKELQAKIDRNNKILKELREDLASSKDTLSQLSPNPDNIEEHIRLLKQKVASYEESCERANAKFTRLSIPEEVYPAALTSLVSSLSELRTEAESLRQRADDIVLARNARDTLAKLARG